MFVRRDAGAAGPLGLWTLLAAAALLAVSAALLGAHVACGGRGRRRRKGTRADPLLDAAVRLAAGRGDVRALARLAHAHPRADVAARTADGFTAVHAAAVGGHAGALAWLLARLPPDACRETKGDGWGNTALHYAAANGHVDAVVELCRRGADKGARDFAGRTPSDVAQTRDVADALAAATAKGGSSGDGDVVHPRRLLFHAADDDGGEGGHSDVRTATSSSLDPARLVARAWEGRNSEGGRAVRPGTATLRVLAVAAQAAGAAYMAWRALRSFADRSPCLSVLFYLSELALFLPSFVFLIELWNPIVRPDRDMVRDVVRRADDTDPALLFPTVDVFIPCYTEPPEVVEATVCAALRLDWPGARLAVHVLDDGRRAAIAKMVERVEVQRRLLRVNAALRYIARPKVKGVPHHAKAGNINHALLCARTAGEYVLVLDSDMVVKPNFLTKTIPHFYELNDGTWCPKPKAAFLQTPQDFYNVAASDPLGHRAAFFYGPMLQGRDGAGACPCVGTGVVFRRDVLVSVGGQAYGSVTEDLNTAMALHASGYSSMYLNERLVYGLAPDDVVGAVQQRLRWAMGSLQILCRDNPLVKPGLTAAQRALYFQSTAQYLLCLPTILLSLLPLLYLFFHLAPIEASLVEFLAIFAAYYSLNRTMLWYAHRGLDAEEIWRGSQMSVWLAPTQLLACLRVLLPKEVAFVVTQKKGQSTGGRWEVVGVIWPHIAYLVLLAGGTATAAVRLAGTAGGDVVVDAAADGAALLWGLLVATYLWPPIGVAAKQAALPAQEEGDEESLKRLGELWGCAASAAPAPADDEEQGRSCDVLVTPHREAGRLGWLSDAPPEAVRDRAPGGVSAALTGTPHRYSLAADDSSSGQGGSAATASSVATGSSSGGGSTAAPSIGATDERVVLTTPPHLLRNARVARAALLFSAAFERTDDPRSSYDYVAYVAATRRAVSAQPTLSRRPLLWLPLRRSRVGMYVAANAALGAGLFALLALAIWRVRG